MESKNNFEKSSNDIFNRNMFIIKAFNQLYRTDYIISRNESVERSILLLHESLGISTKYMKVGSFEKAANQNAKLYIKAEEIQNEIKKNYDYIKNISMYLPAVEAIKKNNYINEGFHFDQIEDLLKDKMAIIKKDNEIKKSIFLNFTNDNSN